MASPPNSAENDSPEKVDVIFQGGGAKLAALIAAADGLDYCRRRGLIEITSITGTSAGAIAGCILAAGKVGDTATELWVGGEGLRLLEDSKPSWWDRLPKWLDVGFWRGFGLLRLCAGLKELGSAIHVARQFWAGKPLWDVGPFEKWLADKLGGDTRLAQLKPPVRARKTDLKACYSELATDGFAWQEAVNSAAFPFVLRLWNSNGPTYVDGGICDNLPVEKATEGSSVLAFTFPVAKPSGPRDMRSFSAALFDAAIANSVRKAVESLPLEQVHTLETTLQTFDFDKAFAREFYEREFPQLQQKTREFVERFCRQKKDEREQLRLQQERMQRERVQIVDEGPWGSKDPIVDDLLKSMAVIHDLQHKTPLNHHFVRIELEATLWRDSKLPCPVSMQFTWSSESDPVHCVQLSLYSANQDGLMVKPDVAVLDDQHRDVPFRLFPMRDSETPSRRCLGVFFTPPLKPNQRFTVRFKELPRLAPEELRELIYMPERAFGKPIEQIELIFHYPQGEG